MRSENCSLCKIEKQIEKFYKKHLECKECKSKKGLRRYYENKDKTSTQRKLFYRKI